MKEYLEISSLAVMSTDNPLLDPRVTLSELPSAVTSMVDDDIPLWNKSAVFSIRNRFFSDLFDEFTIYGTSNKERASRMLLLPTLGLPISTFMRRQSDSVNDLTDLKFLMVTLFILLNVELSIMREITKLF